MKPTTIRRKSPRKSRGTVLPAILALSVGVGALAAGFATQNHREHQREHWEKDRAQSYLDAWAQMEVVAEIVNTAAYDAGTGENTALRAAAARGDGQFVDRDGHLTNVVCVNDGPSGSTGFFRLTSNAQVGEARCRITALVRSRQSFADFDYFVNSQDMGISGGIDTSSAHRDAPDGDIHSNKHLLFYFPDRHFKKAVTAAEGFQFVSGAVGPGGANGNPQNNWLWGQSNSAANPVTGLTTVDLTEFSARSDNILNLNGTYDWAKVKLKGTQARVEHWQYGHNEDQMVTVWTHNYHYVPTQQEVLQAIPHTTTTVQPVYTPTVVPVFGPVAHQQLVTAAWDETVTTTTNVATQVWVPGGGGGATGGGGGSGDVGYWTTVMVPTTTTSIVHHNAVYSTYYVNEWYNTTQNVQTGTQNVTTTTYTYQSYSPQQYQTVQVYVDDGWVSTQQMQTVYEAEHLEATYTVAATGTIYVEGKVEFSTMSTSNDGFGVHTLDGNLTLATNDYAYIRDSIVYSHQDSNNVWQTAYLNGADRTQDYIPNPNYTGHSVLGIIARNDVEIRSDVPDQAELDGTLMARDGTFRVRGVAVASNGTVSTSSSGAFVKMSLRRLGGVISNKRPVTTYVDSNNAVTRGFVYTKSVYDTRQRTNPPRGFPSLNRPKIMATLIREIN